MDYYESFIAYSRKNKSECGDVEEMARQASIVKVGRLGHQITFKSGHHG